jgi:hypothetical protein
MTEDDSKKLAATISEFIRSAEFEPPFHMVAIGSNGAISVSLCGEDGACVELCSHGGPIVPPVRVSLLGKDGGRTTRIEIAALRPTLQ